MIREHDSKYTGRESITLRSISVNNNRPLGISLYGTDDDRINRIKVTKPENNQYNIIDGSILKSITYITPPRTVNITDDNLLVAYREFIKKKEQISGPETYITLTIESKTAEAAQAKAAQAKAAPAEAAPAEAPAEAPTESNGGKSYKTKRHRKFR